MSAPDTNISTEHQPKGAALNPSDTLDRRNEQVPPGQRQWADDSAEKPDATPGVRDTTADELQNASVRRGGQAIGGIAPQPGDPTDPASAEARGKARDDAMRADNLGEDGPRSTCRS
jgi:hypothetical protein